MIRFLVLLLALSGCANTPKYSVDIDSYASGSSAHKKSLFLSSFTDESSLLTAELLNHLEKVLVGRGFVVTKNRNEASALVILTYGMTKDKIVSSRPVYNWVAPSSYNYRSQGYIGSTNYSSSGTIQQQGYGSLNYAGQRTEENTIYIREILIEAMDFDEVRKFSLLYNKSKESGTESPKAPTPLWSTRLQSIGSGNDLRAVLPAMLVVGQPYFGVSSSGIKNIQIDSDDERILFLRAPAQEK